MDRASLVTKHAIKRSKTIKEEPQIANDSVEVDFTDRVLLSLVFDVSQLAENVERIKVQVFTMAKARGIVPPED